MAGFAAAAAAAFRRSFITSALGLTSSIWKPVTLSIDVVWHHMGHTLLNYILVGEHRSRPPLDAAVHRVLEF